MRMASVRIRGVEEAQAVVISVEQQIAKALNAERSLVRVMSGADCASAHRQTAGLNSGRAERHDIRRGKLGRESCVRERIENGSCDESQSGSGGGSGANEKFAAAHGEPSEPPKFSSPAQIQCRLDVIFHRKKNSTVSGCLFPPGL